MNKVDEENNITFFLEDDYKSSPPTTEKDITLLFQDLEIADSKNDFEIDLNMFSSYEKLTCKELLLICEYYGIGKEVKTNKYKKEQIIFLIVSFEANPNHLNTVYQRKNMWFYMNELKNDKSMKKYVLW